MKQPERDPLLGAQVGSYVVEKLIGKGGMGAVYRATHQTLRRRVALKVLLPEFTARADFTARFLQEAMAASHVLGPNGRTHRNVVEPIDTGTLPSGAHWIMVEFLEGRDLEQYTADRGGRLVEDEAFTFIVQACAALHAAHTARDPQTGLPSPIIHRDLKPANLFVTTDDTGRQLLKLLDFGIAKVAGAAMRVTNVVTGGSAVMGTPSYMAPEQARAPLTVDARADLYALGVIIYQLISGRLPHESDNLAGAILAKFEQTPPPLASLVPDLSPIWDVVVRRLLQWDPAKRHASAHAVVADLVHGADGIPGIVDGAAVVAQAWPAYLTETGHADATTRVASPLSRHATPAPPPPSTLGSAAGSPATAATGPRSRLGLAVVGAVLVIGGVVVGVIVTSGSGSRSTAAISTPARSTVTTSPDAGSSSTVTTPATTTSASSPPPSNTIAAPAAASSTTDTASTPTDAATRSSTARPAKPPRSTKPAGRLDRF